MIIRYRVLRCLTLALLCVPAACAQPEHGALGASPQPTALPTSPPTSVHAGHLFLSPEATWFTPCGSEEKWLALGDLSAVSEYLAVRPQFGIPRGWGPIVVYTALRGFVETAPATPAADGRWNAQITAIEVVEVRGQYAGDCRLAATPAATP